MSVRCAAVFVLLQIGFSVAVRGGTVRYELPKLIGEHRYAGETHLSNLFIETSFDLYPVEQAKIVIEGSVLPGKARGDGVILQPFPFDLLPNVEATASFKNSAPFVSEPTLGLFRIDEISFRPFVPSVVPLPCANFPVVSFSVGIFLLPSTATQFPPKIGPGLPILDASEGVIVDVPIIANVTSAYVEFSGPSIVPEPATASLVLAGFTCFLLLRWRAKGGPAAARR